jgi:hypothetical protein
MISVEFHVGTGVMNSASVPDFKGYKIASWPETLFAGFIAWMRNVDVWKLKLEMFYEVDRTSK